MKNKFGKYAIIFLLFCFKLGFSQEKNPTIWPYGAEEDSSRKEPWMEKNPLNFAKANFDSSHFNNKADFKRTQFSKSTRFWWTHFYSRTDFEMAEFDSIADFRWAKFDDQVNFKWVKFKNKIDFWSVIFNKKIDLRYAALDCVAYFSLTQIKDTILVGIPNSSELQRYDFLRTKFLEANVFQIILITSVLSYRQ